MSEPLIVISAPHSVVGRFTGSGDDASTERTRSSTRATRKTYLDAIVIFQIERC